LTSNMALNRSAVKMRFYFLCFPGRALDDVEAVMHKLNHRPRKTLNFKTPHEVFFPEKERDAA